jgi:CheY-like chemotaxis protein
MSAPWIVRVPAFATRPSYLMAERGGARIAIPWHAVLELRMAPGGDADHASHGARSFTPLAHDVIDAGAAPLRYEQPVVLVAHGLKRGYCTVERLIWRMAATPCALPPNAPDGTTEAVATDDGEVFVVASPERLLAQIDTPSFQAHPVFDAAPRVPTLTRSNVVPLPASTAVAEPAVAAPAAPPAPARAAEVLVAEDSIAARLFLVRLLEQQGLVVTSVATSSQLMRRLGERPWALVFTDVELPDAQGVDWLRAVTEAAAALHAPPRVVALVRDRADLDIARIAEVTDTLLKPFGREPLAALLARAGIPATR